MCDPDGYLDDGAPYIARPACDAKELKIYRHDKMKGKRNI